MRKALTYQPTKANVRAHRPQWERVNIIIIDLLRNVKYFERSFYNEQRYFKGNL